MRGTFEIYDGGGILISRVSNAITRTTLNRLRNALSGSGDAPLAATHLALGDGSTAASAVDTALVNEFFRGAFITVTNDTDYILKGRLFLATTDANGQTIRELGVYSAAAGGELIARAVLGTSLAKTNRKSYTLVYTIDLTP